VARRPPTVLGAGDPCNEVHLVVCKTFSEVSKPFLTPRTGARAQVLNLDFCTLGALPAALGALSALTTLDVEGNLYLGGHFRPAPPPGGPPPPPAFPAALGGLQALRYLNLNSCGLTALPAARASSPRPAAAQQACVHLIDLPTCSVLDVWATVAPNGLDLAGVQAGWPTADSGPDPTLA
jgi:hypothetical protein